jgi:hypothetical protein
MTTRKCPGYEAEQVDEIQAKELAKNGIVIYPEVTTGNPLGAERVVRWILYYVREYGEFGIFGANDLIYVYAPIFTLRYPQTITGELRAVELHLDIFRDRNERRSGSCFMLRKQGHKPVIHPSGSTDINDYSVKGGHRYLADVFNKHQRFYSYDDANWCSVQAALCGCLSIVAPRDGLDAKAWHEQFTYFKYGIAYGLNDIEYALSTQHLVRGHLLQLETETIEQTRRFIKSVKD